MREPRWRGAKQLVGINSFGGDKTPEDRLHIFREGKSLCHEFEDAEDDGSGRAIFMPTRWPGYVERRVRDRRVKKDSEESKGAYLEK